MAGKSLDRLLLWLEYRACWLEEEFRDRRLRVEVRDEIEALRRTAEEARRERDRELDELIASVKEIKTGLTALAGDTPPSLTLIQGGDDA
jgi:hypothetical protein